MKLSEAVLLGSTMRPQGFGDLWSKCFIYTPSMLEIEIHSCAWGAALDAVGIHAVGIHFAEKLPVEFRWTQTTNCVCPECCDRFGEVPVGNIIPHLNDDHRWTREQIAEWVAKIEPAEVLDAHHEQTDSGQGPIPSEPCASVASSTP